MTGKPEHHLLSIRGAFLLAGALFLAGAAWPVLTGCSFFSPEDDLSSGGGEYVPPGWTAPDLYYPKSAYFPTRIVEFRQAPGQYADNDSFKIEGNTGKLLGAPVGGGIYGADSSSIVSLGMAGGRVIFEFDPPIENHPDNIGGYDFIVYGNSFWADGNPASPSREPGVIRVMKDADGDGEMNDTWFLIPGSHLDSSDSTVTVEYSVSSSSGEGTLSWTMDGSPAGSRDFSADQRWWPEFTVNPDSFTEVWLLPDALYANPPGLEYSLVWGYADNAPTMILGDLDGNGDTRGTEDYPGIDPVYFYTVPDTHGDNTIDPGSGGGSAIDVEWAVDPSDFSAACPADIDLIRWIEISSGSLITDDLLGERSCEIDTIVRVRREP